MKKYKNTELAKLYKVSEKTVRNWIEAAKKGNVNIDIISDRDRSYIVDTPTNHILLKLLSKKGRKYQNRKSLIEVEPTPEFYEIYSERQIIDIISNLEINKEIAHKYAYFDGGAQHFDEYTNRVLKESAPITIKRTIELLNFNQEYILSLCQGYDKVNVVDIGPGNGIPIKQFLDTLIKAGKLRKYIGVDISPEMLKIDEKNLMSWFGSLFPFEGYVRDINVDSIQEILFKNTHISDVETLSCINVIFFLGSTIENQRKYDESLYTIKSSMGKSDIFVLSQTLDTESSKSHLSFSPRDKTQMNSDLDLLITVLELLNIKKEYYDVYRYYDPKEKARMISIELKYDISLDIKTKSFKQKVNLQKKDNIAIFRHNHHTWIEVLNSMHDIGFQLRHASLSLDQEHLLVAANIKTY